jgi:hypothetical protein
MAGVFMILGAGATFFVQDKLDSKRMGNRNSQSENL